MYTKYYTINIIDTKKIEAERKRIKILRKRIRTACDMVWMLAFSCLIGTIGGFEHDTMTINQAIINSIIYIGIMIASAEIGNRI